MRRVAQASDYDDDPGRFRASTRAVQEYGRAGDVHEDVAQRFAAEGLDPILDLGCGEGRLAGPVRARGLSLVAYDLSATMLATVPGPRVRGDARRLPFRDGSFAGAAALYMLYHLRDPMEAILESYRVLRHGGLFVACAPSRSSDPELATVMPPSPPPTYDAEIGPQMVSDVFQVVCVERWDVPFLRLPDRDALALYLRGRGLSRDEIGRAVRRVRVPLELTKRGALVFGRKLD